MGLIKPKLFLNTLPTQLDHYIPIQTHVYSLHIFRCFLTVLGSLFNMLLCVCKTF